MARSFSNNKDSLEINELASLNEDISDDMIEQLQQQLSQNITTASDGAVSPNINDDSTLFEEVKENASNNKPEEPTQKTEEQKVESKPEVKDEKSNKESEKKDEGPIIQNFDDNFIKKYKAKLKNRQNQTNNPEPVSYDVAPKEEGKEPDSIEALSQGNISERPMTPEIKEYNDSLNFLDGNVKYSKYVMYIDPENVDFIESLTVKERKNLINRILKQQNDIANTKRRFRRLQGALNHIIIFILTLSISIPIVYYAFNASLEATINNHRNAQTIWQTLYKEHGKITQN